MLEDNHTKQEITDESSLDGLEGYPDPFKLDQTAGGGNSGSMTPGNPGGGSSPSTVDRQTEARPSAAELAQIRNDH